MIILNYVACVPVLIAVGGFRYGSNHFFFFFLTRSNNDLSLYHFYALVGNTTTIESWEKDKVAVMVRKGKTREVSLCSVLTLYVH